MTAALRPATAGGRAGRFGTLLAVVLFTFASAGTIHHTLANLNVAGRPELPRYGMQDFRDGIYYPVVAFLGGHNPYDVPDFTSRYPVARKFPLYAPTTLVAYLPFALLPPDVAALTFLVLNLGLTVALASLALAAARMERRLARVCGIAGLVIVSHPGEMALFIGQGAIYFAIGLVLAFAFARSHPALAGAGLALVCMKPTVGIPAALLLAARGERVVLGFGIGLTGFLAVAVVPFLIRAAGGIVPFLGTVADNYGRWGHDAATNVTDAVHRVDAFLIAGRILGRPLSGLEDLVVAGIVFGLAVLAIRRVVHVEDPVRQPLSTSVMTMAILLGTYHQAYDAVLVVLPAVLAASGAFGRSSPARTGRSLVLGAAIVLGFNYASTDALIERYHLSGAAWSAVTLVNAVATTTAFAGCLLVAAT